MEFRNLSKIKGEEFSPGEALKHRAAVKAVHDLLTAGCSIFQNEGKCQDLKNVDLWGPVLLEAPVIKSGKTLAALCLENAKDRVNGASLHELYGIFQVGLCKSLRKFDFGYCTGTDDDNDCSQYYKWAIHDKIRIPDITICDKEYNARVILEFVNKHDLTQEKLQFYSQIPTLKLLCKFDTEKILNTNPLRWGKIIVHRMTWYNGFVWHGERSND
jgi:hypothetical protein